MLEPQQGAFMSFLDWLQRPGQVVKNALTGNFEGAARQAGDFFLDPIDAAIPFVDAIPELSRPEDDVDGAGMLGIDRKKNPVLGAIAGVGVDVVLDPLTWTGLGPLIKGAKYGGRALEQVARQVPRGAEAVDAIKDTATVAGEGVRSVFGARRITPEHEALINAGRAVGANTTAAQVNSLKEILPLLPPADRKLAFQVINNYTRDAAGQAVPILKDSIPMAASVGDIARTGLRGIEEAGQQVSPLLAQDALHMVKKVGKTRGGIDPMDADVGIKGVATKPDSVTDALNQVHAGGTTSANVFADLLHPRWADNAAVKTLDIAYPFKPTEARFASGVDLANKAVMGVAAPTPAVMRGSKALGPVAKAPRPEAPPSLSVDYLSGTPAKVAKEVVDTSGRAAFDTVEGHLSRFGQRLDALKMAGPQRESMMGFFKQWLPHVQAQYRDAVEKGAFSRGPGIDIQREMPADYVMRKFTGMLDESGDAVSAGANAGKERVLRTGEKLIDFLTDPKNAKVTLEEDIAKAGLLRGEQQGRMVQSAHIGKGLIERTADAARTKQVAGQALSTGEEAAIASRYKAFNEDGVGASVKSILDEMHASGFREDANALRDAVFGIAPRGAITDLLAKTNRVFKGAAVYGYVIPKFGSIVRNKVGGIWQALSNPESRGAIAGQAKRLESDLRGAVVDSMGLKVGRDEFSHTLDAWETALKTSNGVADTAIATMAKTHPDAAKLMAAGAMDGFVTSEQLLREMAATGWKKKFMNVADWPARMFRGVEDRMRLGMGLDLMKKGTSAEEAARIVKDTLYDYSVSSAGNRTARDIIPFFQFSAKAIPQQAKLLAEKPGIAIGLGSLMNQQDGQTYPYMDGKLNIPIGDDEHGNPNFLTGTGLPFEVLSSIPNASGGFRELGRDLERGIVGSAHPLLKTAYSVVAGKDPYFESPVGSYSKLPGNIEGGAAGRAYNTIAGTGMIQPLASIVQTLGKVADDRQSPGTKAIDMLTGINIASVDQDRALAQRLTQSLSRRPDIGRFTVPFALDGNSEGARLVEELKDVKKRIKAKRDLEKVQSP